MKFTNPLLVVSDMNTSKKFYQDVLGLHVILDFGANITLTGGICLQTKESWAELISKEETSIAFGGNNTELYFEEDNFDAFIEKLNKIKSIVYVHPLLEQSWGQRCIRFYDPDKHIIEIGENIKVVCRRFIESGLTEEQTAKRMDVPIKFVQACMR